MTLVGIGRASAAFRAVTDPAAQGEVVACSGDPSVPFPRHTQSLLADGQLGTQGARVAEQLSKAGWQ